MDAPQRFSNSEIQTYKDCKRKWWFSHYLKLQKPSEMTGPLAIGNRVHYPLSIYYQPDGTVEAAMAALETSIQDDRDKVDEYSLAKFDKECNLARVMLEGYFEWVEESGTDADLEIVETESELEAEISVQGVPVILQGKRDAIGFNTRTELSLLIDHKTCQSFDDPMLDLNEQARTYLLLQRLNGGTVIQNVSWNLLRKVLRSASAKPPFYKRESIQISEQELRYFWDRIHGEIGDILATKRRLDSRESHRSACYPRPSRDCGWKCPFRVACPMLDADPYFEEYLRDNFTVGDPYARYDSGKEKEI